MNLQFRRGFWAKSWVFSDLRFPYKMFTLQTSFKPLLLGGGGGDKIHWYRWLWIAKRKTLKTFVPITSQNLASGLLYSVLYSTVSPYKRPSLFSLFFRLCTCWGRSGGCGWVLTRPRCGRWWWGWWRAAGTLPGGGQAPGRTVCVCRIFVFIRDIQRFPTTPLDKTLHNTAFLSLNVASLNVIVSKRKSFKT
jgi:hypothetical protein